MKRENHLMYKICELDNLYLAFWKARKGKNGVSYVEDFRDELEINLLKLSGELRSGQISVGRYHYFKIYDPKERTICAANFEERVLHHALMNVCHPVFEKYQIHDSYASRKGKGQYEALERAKYFQNNHSWFIKLDVRKFFDSIEHEALLAILRRKFKEEELLQIFSKLLASYSTAEDKGLPIGNLTSQYFANHYLAVSDHYLKEVLRVKGYVRYMDDMVLWDNDRLRLMDVADQLNGFISEQLKLVLKPFCMNKTHYGLPFLGYVVYKDKLSLNQASRKRLKKKLKAYEENLLDDTWSESEYQKRTSALLAFANHADTFKLRKKLIN
jgi:RNA-directed DNA polymerase